MPERISMILVRKIARELLASFSELPGFSTAKLGEIHRIYDSQGKTAYYEVKFVRGRNDNGYAIISATEEDLPVVEFSHRGRSHHERFKKQLGHDQFYIHRFGPTYITAEDSNGKLLGEIGERPNIVANTRRFRARGEKTSFRRRTATPINLNLPRDQVTSLLAQPEYQVYRSTFKHVKPRSSMLKHQWKEAKSPHSPVEYNYYYAWGWWFHPYFRQIAANTPPNNTDHKSGCGPTAWMNIYGWHNLHWAPSVLDGWPDENNSYIRELTMDLHDRLGTFNVLGYGFTWPEDMEKGIDFVQGKLRHDCSYWLRYDYGVSTDEPWVFRVARDAAREQLPFIVGYSYGTLGINQHYGIGYGIAEENGNWRNNSWIYVYPATSTNGDDDKWINMASIFAIYAVYTLKPYNKQILPERSHHSPALLTAGGKTVLSWIGTANSRINVMNATTDLNFENKVILPEKSSFPPALAYLNNRYYMAYIGVRESFVPILDADPVYATADGQSIVAAPFDVSGVPITREFSMSVYRDAIVIMESADCVTWNTIATLYEKTAKAPALDSFEGKLRLVFRGENDRLIMMSSSDGINWSDRSALPYRSSSGPALTNIDVDAWGHPAVMGHPAVKELYLAWRENDSIRIAQSTDGINFTRNSRITICITYNSPALVARGKRLYLAWKAPGGKLLTAVRIGGDWKFKITYPEYSYDAPSIAPHGEKLILSWTGTTVQRINIRQENI